MKRSGMQRCTYEGCGVVLYGGGTLIHHEDGSHSGVIGAERRTWCLCSLIGHQWDRPLSDTRDGWIVVCLRNCCRGTDRGTRWPTLPRKGEKHA